jgi:uncharacterized protein
MINRLIYSQIKNCLNKQKIIILYGPRQVGKTTLLNQLKKEWGEGSEYFLADRPSVKALFDYNNIDRNLSEIAKYELILLDEAQNIPNIGQVLKIIGDTYPRINIIATGSSSFDLANKTAEPLTGRSIMFHLYPLSYQELYPSSSFTERQEILNKMLIYGSYPEVFLPTDLPSINRLENIASNYLYKDVLQLADINRPELLEKLLQALALQISCEVSYAALANLLDISIVTVERYIQLLEDSFIIFRLQALARNHRTEINKTRKIYFWDLGIRNYLINSFNDLNLRDDTGKLWENFCVSERLKYNRYNQKLTKAYFWRNYAQAEIDYIEEKDGQFDTFEFKYNPNKKTKLPKNFSDNYSVKNYQTITPQNISELLID